ncbi:diaminopimelate epimerase [Paractinoplanes rishiriensis]|uniref:diaminopimelate epimerase n=1 Tax=Paractinoplanes rishiriensis TaxID=1050105 RepID=UPI0019453E34|nr:diaminopimelate epimerase [Actinoplanes rishiriensis]
MKFTKGHGTGNDFVILPDPDGALELTPQRVTELCDRRFGIGGDGVLRVVRSAKEPDGSPMAAEAEWFMDYRNSDGSVAEMCGNGVRVFARYLLSEGLATPGPSGLPIATRAGVVVAVVEGDEIRVHMTTPRVYAASTATVGPLTFTGMAVDCGNPHLVCTLHDGVELSSLDLSVSPGFDRSLFAAGVNVEFVVGAEPVESADLHVAMRVYERGSGETLSCGTGALAVGAVALRDAGRSTGVVAVDVPGGRLTVTHDETGRWWLAGPAVLVATGEVAPGPGAASGGGGASGVAAGEVAG